MNVSSGVGGCAGSAAGPTVDGYYPTASPGAFQIYKSSSSEVDFQSGSSIPKLSLALYAPLSWGTCSGAPNFRLFGSVMLDSFTNNGCLTFVYHDRALPAKSSASYGDLGLESNTTYVYRVRATSGGEDSGYSNEATATTLASLSGNIAGGTSGSISVYDSSGDRIAYECCMGSEFWQIEVPDSTCSVGGYRVLWLPPDSSKSPSWIAGKQTYSTADCLSAPAMNNDMTPVSNVWLSGYVKDKLTAADIDGAVAYAFDATTGTYSGWSQSGDDGSGRYSISVPGPGPYKIRVIAPPGHTGQWHDGRSNFSEATAVAAPDASVNFSLPTSDALQGYVKDATTAADLNGYPVYAYTQEGQFFAYAMTDRGYGTGRYQIEAEAGTPFKLLSGGGPYGYQWYSGSTSFTAATATVAPSTANFSL